MCIRVKVRSIRHDWVLETPIDVRTRKAEAGSKTEKYIYKVVESEGVLQD